MIYNYLSVIFGFQVFNLTFREMPFHFSNRTEQNFYWFEIHIYKGLLPKQNIKYKELFCKEVKISLADYQY
jgi:hypothetical protein